MIKTGLGKGLSALIPIDSDLDKNEPVTEISLKCIKPNSFQPRRTFDEEKLTELADSIKEHGVIQPVVVRPIGPDTYELVVGERRLRACQILQLDKIPAVIKELYNQQMMEIAIIENIQRQDLNPVEEAYAYKRLIEEFKLTQEQVAQKISKSRAFVANMVRLLNLPPVILENVIKGYLTVGHVRPLLTLENEEKQINLAEKIIAKNMTVRDAETFVKQFIEENAQKKQKERNEKKLPPFLQDIESRLRSVCGTKVKIKQMGERGKIEIDYYNNDDLDRIISIFDKEGL